MQTENIIDYQNSWTAGSFEFFRNSGFSLSLNALTEEQKKTTLALKQLEETQQKLFDTFSSQVGNVDNSNQQNQKGLMDILSDIGVIVTLLEVFSGGNLSKWIGKKAIEPLIKPATKILPKALPVLTNPITLGLATMMGGLYGTMNLLEYEMQKGWIPRNNMEDVNRTANTIDEIMAASNPHITPYDAVTELPAGRRARSTKTKLADSKERRANIAMALETLNNVGEIYADSSPISYGEPATFNDWQNQWFRTLDAQQSIIYNNQSSRSSPNVTVNMTNTFPQPIRDPYQVREIGDILAEQLKSRLNSGAPLMAPGW